MEVDVCMVMFDGRNGEFGWVDLKVEFYEPMRWVLKSVWNGGYGVVLEKHSCVGELRGEGESLWCSYYKKNKVNGRWRRRWDRLWGGMKRLYGVCHLFWKKKWVCELLEWVSFWKRFFFFKEKTPLFLSWISLIFLFSNLTFTL